ncbi:uncharacterized protein LOC101855531 [Aplysia californica]|uniref:Uncharacterized protein LOC101855531 n=1 Tax=Aplysia californica TaxID=6500 RepID=A0ABM1AC67_APLCA|nr:uncharacterized protein LOC101855531 [Aplysia californica]
MDAYKLPAGVPFNEAVLLALRIRKTAPRVHQPDTLQSPHPTDHCTGPGGHEGWNPVYWSDYPRQPAWTVPLPKLAGPSVSHRRPSVTPTLPCHAPPTEHMTSLSCPSWMPDPPCYNRNYNPYVHESNAPFQHLLGPSTIR